MLCLYLKKALGPRIVFVRHIVVRLIIFKIIFKFCIKLMKGKALRKHSLHEKTAASVLLKLFISSNE